MMTRDEAIRRAVGENVSSISTEWCIAEEMVDRLIRLGLLEVMPVRKSLENRILDFVRDPRLAQGGFSDRWEALPQILADHGLQIVDAT